MIYNLIQQENHITNSTNIPNLWKPKIKQQHHKETRKNWLEGDLGLMGNNILVSKQLNCKKIQSGVHELSQNSSALKDIQNLKISCNTGNDENYIEYQNQSFQQQRTRNQKPQNKNSYSLEMTQKTYQTQPGAPSTPTERSSSSSFNYQAYQLSENIHNHVPKINHLQIQLYYVRKSNDFEPKYTIKKSKHANSTKENEPNTIEEIQKQIESCIPQQSHHFSHITPILHNLSKRAKGKPLKNSIKKNIQTDPSNLPTLDILDNTKILFQQQQFLPPNMKPKDAIFKNKVRSNKNYKQLYYNIQRIQNNYKQMQQKFSDTEDLQQKNVEKNYDEHIQNNTQFEKWTNDSENSEKNQFQIHQEDQERRGLSAHFYSRTIRDSDRKVFKKVASQHQGNFKIYEDQVKKNKNSQKNNYLNIRFNQNEIQPWDDYKDLQMLDDLC